MTNADFITGKRPVNVTIDLENLDPATGFKMRVESDPTSRIELIEAVDIEIFRQQVLLSLQKIAVAAIGPKKGPVAYLRVTVSLNDTVAAPVLGSGSPLRPSQMYSSVPL